MEKSFETVLVEQCAPILAGIKPANLFLDQSTNRESVRHNVERLGKYKKMLFETALKDRSKRIPDFCMLNISLCCKLVQTNRFSKKMPQESLTDLVSGGKLKMSMG